MTASATITIAPARTRSKLLLCAGQGCSQRWNCQRFRARGYGMRYASFDLERQAFGGNCPAFEPNQQGNAN